MVLVTFSADVAAARAGAGATGAARSHRRTCRPGLAPVGRGGGGGCRLRQRRRAHGWCGSPGIGGMVDGGSSVELELVLRVEHLLLELLGVVQHLVPVDRALRRRQDRRGRRNRTCGRTCSVEDRVVDLLERAVGACLLRMPLDLEQPPVGDEVLLRSGPAARIQRQERRRRRPRTGSGRASRGRRDSSPVPPVMSITTRHSSASASDDRSRSGARQTSMKPVLPCARRDRSPSASRCRCSGMGSLTSLRRADGPGRRPA